MSRNPLWLLAFVSFACRYQPSPVTLQGADADVSALAGEWAGEYSSEESGRSGAITFTVRPGSDTAYGDVSMAPQMNHVLRAADFGTPAHERHVSAPNLLQVTFIRVRGGMIEGSLEPYVAPDCNCVVRTVFRGTLRTNAIQGEYDTRGEGGLRQAGAWRVQRKP